MTDRQVIPPLVRDYRGSVRATRRFGAALTGFLAAMDQETAALMSADPRVVAVDQDQVIEHAATQTAPPWGLDRIDQVKRPLDETYNHAGAGRGVSVYVLDSGIMRSHTQFGRRVARGFDGLRRGSTADCHGHGTHVSGTIAGATYGVAKAARIVPVRVMNCRGDGTASSLIAGLDFVARHHRSGTPAVANLSLGGSASGPVDRAINRVIDDGVTVVTAAGNEGANACYVSPARVSRALTVGAVNRSDYAPDWSNYGPCLDVFAPGAQVVSAGIATRTSRRTMSGTSMAAPHVAGIAARYLGLHPRAMPGRVARHLTSSATPSIVANAGYNTTRKLAHSPGRAPVALSHEASASIVAAGDVVTLTGVLRNSWSGVVVAGQPVSVYRRPQGATSWTMLTSRTTDAGGRVSVVVEVNDNVQYQLRHAATATTKAAASGVRSVALDPRVGTALSLSSGAPLQLALGQSLNLAATLENLGTGQPVAGQTVELRTRRAGSRDWTFVDSRTTDGLGNVAFTHTPRHNSEYRMHHLGSDTTLASMSSIAQARVSYRVTSQASATTLEEGETVWITGRIEPVTAAGWAEVWYDDGWGESYHDTVSYDAAGNFAYADTPYWAGSHTYQIVMPADASNTAGQGPQHAVSVWCADYEYC